MSHQQIEPLGYNTATTHSGCHFCSCLFEQLPWALINLYNQDEPGSASCCVGIDVRCTVVYSKSMRQQQAKTDQCLGWTAQLSEGGRQMMLQESSEFFLCFHSLKSDITHIQAPQSQSNIKPTSVTPQLFPIQFTRELLHRQGDSSLTVLPISLVNQERHHQFIDGSAAQLMWRCRKMLQEKHRTRMYMLVQAKLLQSFPEMQVETWVNNHEDSLLGLLHVFIVQESPNCKNAIQRTETGSGCVSADRTACWSMTVQVVHIYTETSHRGKRNSILKQKTKKYIKQVPGIKVPPSSIAKKGTLFYYCFSF